MKKRILIVGLFSDPAKYPVTQAGELAKVLKANGYEVLTVSSFRNRFLRIVDIVRCFILNGAKFDVAIVQFYSGFSLVWQSVAIYLAKLLEKKLIVTIHGGGVPQRIKARPSRYLNALKKADVITCPSDYIIEALKEYGLKAELIRNSIALSQYRFVEKRSIGPRLLWMRGFSPLYNPEMAVGVVQELKKNYPDVKLYMGGYDLGSLQSVKTQIRELGLEDNIELVGFMDNAKKAEYASKADVFISTNRVDNAPVSFLEMWVMGLPVVSTGVGGIPYLINDGVTGLLAKDDDAVDMAAKISQLIEWPQLATTMIENSRKAVSRYGEEEVFVEWDKLLCSI